MPAPAPAAFLTAGLLLLTAVPRAALASGLCQINSDTCLQRVFLSSPDCNQIDPSYTNETLSAAGFYCCWAQGPFTPPPAQAVSAWLTISDAGEVTARCLTRGSCPRYYDLPEYTKDCENGY